MANKIGLYSCATEMQQSGGMVVQNNKYNLIGDVIRKRFFWHCRV